MTLPIGTDVEYYSVSHSCWIPTSVAHVHPETGSIKLALKGHKSITMHDLQGLLRPHTEPNETQLEWVKSILREKRCAAEAEAMLALDEPRGVLQLHSEDAQAVGARLDAKTGTSGSVLGLTDHMLQKNMGYFNLQDFTGFFEKLLWDIVGAHVEPASVGEGDRVEYYSGHFKSWLPVTVVQVDAAGAVKLDLKGIHTLGTQEQKVKLRPVTRPSPAKLEQVKDLLREGRCQKEAYEILRRHTNPWPDANCQKPFMLLRHEHMDAVAKELDAIFGISGSVRCLKNQARQAGGSTHTALGVDDFTDVFVRLMTDVISEYSEPVELPEGTHVDYFNDIGRRWQPAMVTRVNPDGHIELDVRPNLTLRVFEQKLRIRPRTHPNLLTTPRQGAPGNKQVKPQPRAAAEPGPEVKRQPSAERGQQVKHQHRAEPDHKVQHQRLAEENRPQHPPGAEQASGHQLRAPPSQQGAQQPGPNAPDLPLKSRHHAAPDQRSRHQPDARSGEPVRPTHRGDAAQPTSHQARAPPDQQGKHQPHRDEPETELEPQEHAAPDQRGEPRRRAGPHQQAKPRSRADPGQQANHQRPAGADPQAKPQPRAEPSHHFEPQSRAEPGPQPGAQHSAAPDHRSKPQPPAEAGRQNRHQPGAEPDRGIRPQPGVEPDREGRLQDRRGPDQPKPQPHTGTDRQTKHQHQAELDQQIGPEGREGPDQVKPRHHTAADRQGRHQHAAEPDGEREHQPSARSHDQLRPKHRADPEQPASHQPRTAPHQLGRHQPRRGEPDQPAHDQVGPQHRADPERPASHQARTAPEPQRERQTHRGEPGQPLGPQHHASPDRQSKPQPRAEAERRTGHRHHAGPDGHAGPRDRSPDGHQRSAEPDRQIRREAPDQPKLEWAMMVLREDIATTQADAVWQRFNRSTPTARLLAKDAEAVGGELDALLGINYSARFLEHSAAHADGEALSIKDFRDVVHEMLWGLVRDFVKPPALAKGSKLDYYSVSYRCWRPAVVVDVDSETKAVKIDVRPNQLIDIEEQKVRFRPRTKPDKPRLSWVRQIIQEDLFVQESKAIFDKYASRGRNPSAAALLHLDDLELVSAELDMRLGINGTICAFKDRVNLMGCETFTAEDLDNLFRELVWGIMHDHIKPLNWFEGDQVDYRSLSHNCWLPATVVRMDPETGAAQLDVRPDQPLGSQDQQIRLRPRTKPNNEQLQWMRQVCKKNLFFSEARVIFFRHAQPESGKQEFQLQDDDAEALGNELDGRLGTAGAASLLNDRIQQQEGHALSLSDFREIFEKLVRSIVRDDSC